MARYLLPPLLLLFALLTQGTVMVRRTGVLLTDWCPTSGTGCVALWKLEEASNTTRYATGGTCGADCALLDVIPGVSQDSNEMEGTYSADFTYASGDTLYCSDATCGELDFSSGGVTFGCWSYSVGDTYTQELIVNMVTGDFTGYRLRRRPTTDDMLCTIGDGTDLQSANTDETVRPWNVNTWYHTACTSDGTNIKAYWNGVNDGTQAQGTVAADNATFRVSGPTTLGWDGKADECVVYAVAFDANEMCRWTRCGIRGELCMCDSTDPTQFKACSVDNDCRVQANTTAICNTGYCTGRTDYDTCTSMGNCNAGAPT